LSETEVVLVNPNRLQPGVAPIALEYLASELERRSIAVRILDLCHARKPREVIRAFFRAARPQLVGITIRNMDDVIYNCFLAGEMKYLVEAIKRATRAPIVLGGSGFSIAPELLLDYYGVDLGIVGEGEEALPMLLERLDTPARYSEVPGLVYRDGSQITRNPMGCADVNAFRLVKRGRIRYEDYSYRRGRKGGAGVQTKRGCPNRCIYCVVPNVEGSTVRLRDPQSIADEMENLAACGVTRVFLCDSEFNHPIEHAMAVCSEFIARGIQKRLSWQAYASPGQFNVELARKMKEAGCDLVLTTVDSGNDSLLERLGKSFRTEDIVTCVRACQEAGLNAIYSVMLGGPGETMDTVLKTLEFMGGIKPAKVAFGEPPGLRIYPGTPLEAIVRREGFSPSNPNLRGRIKGNEDLLEPVYYMSHRMGILVPMIQLWRKIGCWHHLVKHRT